jgi:hypothetical protein
MPEKITQNYVFGGWATQLIWSEQEMADALGISVRELRARLDWTEYGDGNHYEDIGLSFHAHPFSNAPRQFQFHEQSYLENIKVWSCVEERGHFFEDNPKYDYLPKGAVTCTNCGYTRYG